jgi:hypothetical protein
MIDHGCPGSIPSTLPICNLQVIFPLTAVVILFSAAKAGNPVSGFFGKSWVKEDVLGGAYV